MLLVFVDLVSGLTLGFNGRPFFRIFQDSLELFRVSLAWFKILRILWRDFFRVISCSVGLVQGFEDLMDRLMNLVDLVNVLWFEGSYGSYRGIFLVLF